MSLPVKCVCVSLLLLAFFLPARCFVDKFDLFSARRNCYCEVAEGFRQPCYRGEGGNLDENSCREAGCCFLEPLLEGAPRCFLRKKTCENKCHLEKYMREPCMGWLTSKSSCESNGCCYDHSTFPSCYHGADQYFVDFVANSKPMEELKQPTAMDEQLQTLFNRVSKQYKEVRIVTDSFNFVKMFPHHVNCYCDLPNPDRKPCIYGGAKLDRHSCNKHGCCYQKANDTDTPACYERKDTCNNQCGVNVFQRKPCLTVYSSGSECRRAGCCYEKRNVPSCYRTADDTYEKFLNRNIFYEWSPWSEWSVCTSSCTPGVTHRSRVCRSNEGVLMDDEVCDQNPEFFQSKACNENFCPQWSDWIEDTKCTANCYEKLGSETYSRTCLTAKDGDSRPESYGCYLELRPCENTFSCEGVAAWGDWQAWSPCSDACTPGIKERSRTCNRDGNVVDILECENSEMFAEIESCNDHLCVEWSDWEVESECNAKCRSKGDQNFVKTCLNKPDGFQFAYHEKSCYSETRTCDGPPVCPSTWGEWEEWSVCSGSCSPGTQERTRTCINENGAIVENSECGNPDLYFGKQSCNDHLCRRWSDWTAESECTASCKSTADHKFIKECLNKPEGFDLDEHDVTCYSDMRTCSGPSKCPPTWGAWQEWSVCSDSCGPGIQERNRLCYTEEGNLIDENECDGSFVEKQACNDHLCTKWSDWTEEAECTALCRSSSDQNFGRNCLDETQNFDINIYDESCYSDTKTCDGPPICPPTWGEWEEWSVCSESCSPGIQNRVRLCYNENGTLVDNTECENPESFTNQQSCNDLLCLEWSEWEAGAECSALCRSNANQTFARTCINETDLTLHESTCYSDTRTCDGPPICPPTWGEWEEWSVCSESCSPGIQNRKRSCYNENGTLVDNIECENSDSFTEDQSCNDKLCVEWSEWVEESLCSATCKSSADQKYLRTCLNATGFDDSMYEESCYSDNRTCDGPSICPPTWGEWEEWSSCSESCSPGLQNRLRSCYSENGTLVNNTECENSESFVEEQNCNNHLCLLWSEWEAESECSALCRSNANQTFARTCINETDLTLHENACYSDIRTCDGPPICPPTWGEWEEWSVCSESCSPGTQDRFRSCYNENGTLVNNTECENPDSFTDQQSCNDHLCVEWSEWESEAECSAFCRSSANQTFARTCTNETDLTLYEDTCYSNIRTCNGPHICAPTWGEWDEWSVCSESCSPGVQSRIRSCYNENGTLVDNTDCENPESFSEDQACNDDLCLEWSEWTADSECSALCRSSADQPFVRVCLNSSQSFDIDSHEESCYSYNRTCDGPSVCPPTWGEWEEWSVCSDSCSPGVQDRFRSCYNENGTLVNNTECENPESFTDQQSCNNHLCVEWSEWEAETECSALCRSSANQTFARECINETDLTLYKESCYFDTKICDGPSVCPPTWGEWEEWSVCSDSCSPGIQERFRSCYNENGTHTNNTECENPDSFTEEQSCNDHLCTEWSEWESEDECSASCKSSYDMEYLRTCLNETNFDGSLYEESCYSDNRTCAGPPVCAPTWGEWEEWSVCSEYCSPGTQVRYRSCYNEAGSLVNNTECGNADSFTEVQICNDHLCVEWSEWESEAECSALCRSNANQTFARTCINETDLTLYKESCYFGTKMCDGPSVCPPTWGEWEEWSVCSESCSPGTQQRLRYCYNENGTHVNDTECKNSDSYVEVQNCNQDLCLEWSEWIEETECLASCRSSSNQMFFRTCRNETNLILHDNSCYSDNRTCDGPSICPPTWGEWEEWSACSDSCSPGMQERFRFCYNETGSLVNNTECGNPESFVEEQICNDHLCLEWSEWEAEAECSALCRSNANQTFARTCINETDLTLYEHTCYSNIRTCDGPSTCPPTWGEWEEWSVCSESCSPGTQDRFRSCYNENGTLVNNTECENPESFVEEQSCNDHLCIEWSEWTEEDECSASCRSNASQKYFRTCLNETDITLYESSCYSENRTCDGPPICPPTWGEWDEWSVCSESCIPGIQERFRSCYNENGTLVNNTECENPDSFTDQQSCNDHLCVEWSEWIEEDECNATCRSTADQNYFRTCLNETNFDASMYEESCYSDNRTCDGPPVCPPTWGEWDEWSFCSESCSPGIQNRIRSCYNENGTLVNNTECSNSESFTEERSCNDHLCHEWAEWTPAAECTALCRKTAPQKYTRECLDKPEDFDLDKHADKCHSDIRTCNGPKKCPPNWGVWQRWSLCSEPCSPGTQKRTRLCYTEQGHLVDKNECKRYSPETFVEEQTCNDHLCTKWTDWTEEAECTALCKSDADQNFGRKCLDANWDINIYSKSCYFDTRKCKGPKKCPPAWGEWKEWSVCSESCGPGVQTRLRSCYNENGDLVSDSKCENPESFSEEQSCNDDMCLEWSEWTADSECSALCRSSTDQPFVRICLNSSQSFDIDSYDESCYSDTKTCDGPSICPPTWGEWEEWSVCSDSCGPGVQNRVRSCNNENGTLVNNTECENPDSFMDQQSCNDHLCPEWAEWEAGPDCDALCRSTSNQTYFRVCLNETHFDITAHENECYSEQRMCFGEPICPPTWGEWEEWSVCSESCSPGIQERIRYCYNENGTLVNNTECENSDSFNDQQNCNEDLCIVWTEWEAAAECTALCRSSANQTFLRTCLSSSGELELVDYESFCHTESRICDGTPTCPPTWGEWGNWSTCSSSCSPGTASRTRSCYTENGTLTENEYCSEPHSFIDYTSCNDELCQEWGNFTVKYECNAECDDTGIIEYTRVCQTDNTTIFNYECTSDSSVCSGPLCPGTYGPWSDWSSCEDDCGPSIQNRTRSCFVKGVLVNDSRCLEGEPDEMRECNIDLCPEWSEWTDSKCVADCDEAGHLLKTRTCNAASYNRKLTPKECHNQTHDCVRTCVISWAEWAEWTDCSNKCAVGNATRERGCLVDGEAAAMRYCDSIPQGSPADDVHIVRDRHMETRTCNLGICPDWSPWSVSTCTALNCGEVGVQRRQRVCQSSGGMSPKTAQVFAMECYQDTVRCIGYCRPIFGQWTGWGPCSEKCGVGTTTRNRRCIQQGKSVDPQICADAHSNQIANETRACNQGLCTNWSPWKPMGTCSSDCNGKIKMARQCLGPGYTRPFTSSPRDRSCTQKTETCGSSDCKVFYTDWNTWGPCSRRCGRGSRRRFRHCLSEKDGEQLSEPFRKCSAFGLPVERERCEGTRC